MLCLYSTEGIETICLCKRMMSVRMRFRIKKYGKFLSGLLHVNKSEWKATIPGRKTDIHKEGMIFISAMDYSLRFRLRGRNVVFKIIASAIDSLFILNTSFYQILSRKEIERRKGKNWISVNVNNFPQEFKNMSTRYQRPFFRFDCVFKRFCFISLYERHQPHKIKLHQPFRRYVFNGRVRWKMHICFSFSITFSRDLLKRRL